MRRKRRERKRFEEDPSPGFTFLDPLASVGDLIRAYRTVFRRIWAEFRQVFR